MTACKILDSPLAIEECEFALQLDRRAVVREVDSKIRILA